MRRDKLPLSFFLVISLNSCIVTCPKCGSNSLKIEQPVEITYGSFLNVSIECLKCGYKGRVKVEEGKTNELDVFIE
jgi:C4-type Zn-finger protein